MKKSNKYEEYTNQILNILNAYVSKSTFEEVKEKIEQISTEQYRLGYDDSVERYNYPYQNGHHEGYKKGYNDALQNIYNKNKNYNVLFVIKEETKGNTNEG